MSEEMNTKEKIKNFWKDFKKNTIWFSIGTCTGLIYMKWVLFYFGIIDLMLAIFLTVLYPLSIFLVYYVRKSKHPNIIEIIAKIMLIGCSGYVFGLILWLFLGYLLIQAPWAPLRNVVIKGRILLLMLPTLCVIGGYIMYRISKKIKWRPLPVLKSND